MGGVRMRLISTGVKLLRFVVRCGQLLMNLFIDDFLWLGL